MNESASKLSPEEMGIEPNVQSQQAEIYNFPTKKPESENPASHQQISPELLRRAKEEADRATGSLDELSRRVNNNGKSIPDPAGFGPDIIDRRKKRITTNVDGMPTIPDGTPRINPEEPIESFGGK